MVSVSSPLGRVGRRDWGDLDQIIGYWFAAAIIGRRDLGDLDQIIGYYFSGAIKPRDIKWTNNIKYLTFVNASHLVSGRGSPTGS